MSEFTPVAILPMEDFVERHESGLLVPMDAETGLQVMDCGDVRPLTVGAEMQRTARYGELVSPGRYFGGQVGFGVTALMAMTAQNGEHFMSTFVDTYTPEALAVFSADLAERAAARESDKMELNLHSANDNEANDVEMDLDLPDTIQPGCKFMVYAGAVLMNAGSRRALEEAIMIAELTGQELPLDEVSEAARVLGAYLPPSFSVGRDAVKHAREHTGGHVAHTVLKGAAVQNEQTAVVMDMAGYRSNAGLNVHAGLPRYHHTPGLANRELPILLPEYKLDPELIAASSLLIGVATGKTLSGPGTPNALRTEIIPHEYGLAA